MTCLKISVTFLAGTFHGRSDRGRSEWPPSPLRVFQALVASAARIGDMSIPDNIAEALDWLASQPAPVIVTPPAQPGVPYQTSVPNNAMDIVARAWSRGSDSSKDAQPSTHKAMKTVCPTYLDPGIEDGANHTVNYLWRISDETNTKTFVDTLATVASQLVAVGWGLDLVAGHASVLSDETAAGLTGDRWLPSDHGDPRLPVPTSATRRHLEDRHTRFLRRVASGTLNPVPPIPGEATRSVCYRRDFEPAPSTFAAFSLLKPDASRFRSLPLCKGTEVAAMLRHAVSEAARRSGWDEDRIARFVLGHGESRSASSHIPSGPARFAYVPLPSLEPRSQGNGSNHVGMIRRVLVHVPAGGHADDIQWVRRALAGNDLIREQDHQSAALISPLPSNDNVVQRFLGQRTGGGPWKACAAATWSTVTPVILPGFDDRRRSKTETLLRRAIVQAGFSETLARHADLDWRSVGFFPGADRVDRYFVPKHLENYPRYHVKVTWKDSHGQRVRLDGPIVIGGGRYIGLGLFAADSE